MRQVTIPPTYSTRKALSQIKRGLIEQFSGIWPQPRATTTWVQETWLPLIKGKVDTNFCGRVFFTFLLEFKEDKHLIFRNIPYFMGPRGLFLNKWSLGFDPNLDVPSVVTMWVNLRHLPMHFWNQDAFVEIGNSLVKYLDFVNSKENFSFARICIDVDLEVGFLVDLLS